MGFKFNPTTSKLDLVNDENSNQYTKTASHIISALKLISAIDETSVAYAENDSYENSKVLGITLNAAGIGDDVTIQCFGEIKDPSFNFTVNEPLFLGSNGTITSTPSNPFVVNIGHGMGSGSIFLKINEQIEIT